MLLKCVTIDDDPLSNESVNVYIQKTPVLELVNSFEDAAAGLEYIKRHPVDLLFINVQNADVNRQDVLTSATDKPIIIFTTTHKKFSAEGFELDAVDYLLKPFSYDRFKKAVAKAEEFYKYKTSLTSRVQYLYVYSEYRLIKINFDNIEFIESLEDYIRIYLTSGKPVLTRMPFKKMIQKVPADRFMRVHRSYVVALGKIKSFTNKKVVLENAEVPVSESYVDVIRKLRKP